MGIGMGMVRLWVLVGYGMVQYGVGMGMVVVWYGNRYGLRYGYGISKGRSIV